ncbi:MAG TPA: formate C-acetyltransferase/glycerol dehydratase family glycyl radical enzyme [Anaerolineaceae bacterium]|nr:formate C-acetyltransferase/glycerol dehydratase family glycyl radical enzyme [Anaerolineaceae bacterium]
MSDRVNRLRQQSLDAVESLSSERAELLTDFYLQKLGIMSVPVQRAMSFAYLLEHKKIAIYEGELIVGEKGESPKAAPSFPELCCHTLEDLDILNTRSLTSFRVSVETRKAYQEKVIPFWQGKSIRDLLFAEMTPEWKDAYDAGIFTEFMEQRAPGHTVLDEKIYHYGMLDFQQKIDASLTTLDFLNDPEAYDKQEELKAMCIAAEALMRFAERYSTLALELAQKETNTIRKKELEKIAQVCSHIPAHAPRDLHEALQYYWFVHLGVTTELNTWDSYCPGRLDQHLLPFYEQGLANGTLTKESAKELLCCFWIKFNNQPAPPKVGVTAAESGTYTDFAQINLGGLRPDGSDGVNEVSYLLLDVIEEMRLLQPSSSIQVSKKSPDRFIKRAARIIRTGYGQPSIFNADLIVQQLMRAGKSLVDARCGGSSGCVEVGAFGKENYNLTGYFNLPKVLELTLYNGLDPRTGQQLGPQTGDAADFTDFDQLFNAFERQLLYFVDLKVCGNQVIERLYANYMPAPFLSLLTDDCISSGKDYHNGGARYNTSYIQGVGIGSIADALAAIKTHVYEQQTFNMDELLKMLDSNFEGVERSRQLLLNRTPKYGNDDDAADDLMVRVFESYFNAVDGRRNTKGGEYHINMLPTTCHIYFGSVTGALPDGRFTGKPLSEGVSPVQGADRHGPTAVVRSVAKMDQVRTGGTLLNQKFTPQVLDSEEGLNALVQLVRGYFNLDGHHIQFNVVDGETLKAAQANPEQYRSLIVRVAGYSDYFCDLSKQLQDEIITRTAYGGF